MILLHLEKTANKNLRIARGTLLSVMWQLGWEASLGENCYCLVAKLCLTLYDPMDCGPPTSSIHGISQQECWSRLQFPLPGDLPYPEIWSPSLAGVFFTTEPSGKLSWRRTDPCVCMAEFLCCPPETISTLLISYTP